MSSERCLRVGVDLFKALTELQGREPLVATPTVVVAAFLVTVAADYGLSDSPHLDGSHLDHLQPPVEGRPLLNRYFPNEPGGRFDGLDVEVVRDRLYEALVSLAADTGVRQAVNKRDPLSELGLLKVAQIYWNLEATRNRSGLPIASGQALESAAGGSQSADIKVPGANKDFALLKHTNRCAIGAHGIGAATGTRSSGQGFRTLGARLAVLVAQWLVSHDQVSHDTDDRHASARLEVTASEGRQKSAVIRWGGTTALTVPSSDAGRPSTDLALPDPEIEAALERRVVAALESGDYRGSERGLRYLASALQERSEVEPIDHEKDLAGYLAIHGLVLENLGRTAEAMESCSSAIAILEVHVDLAPEDGSAPEDLALALASRAGMLSRHEDALSDLVRDTERVLDLVEANRGLRPARVSLLLTLLARLWVLWLQDGLGLVASSEVGARVLKACEANLAAHANSDEALRRAAQHALACAYLLLATSARDFGATREVLANALNACDLVKVSDSEIAQQTANAATLLARKAYRELGMYPAATRLGLELVSRVASDQGWSGLPDQVDRATLLQEMIRLLWADWEMSALAAIPEPDRVLSPSYEHDNVMGAALIALRDVADSFDAILKICRAAVRTLESHHTEEANRLNELIEEWEPSGRSIVDGLKRVVSRIESRRDGD